MRVVMVIIARSCPSNKIVQGLHLNSHVLHLSIDNSDSLLMDRFRSGLDRVVMVTDSLSANS